MRCPCSRASSVGADGCSTQWHAQHPSAMSSTVRTAPTGDGRGAIELPIGLGVREVRCGVRALRTRVGLSAGSVTTSGTAKGREAWHLTVKTTSSRAFVAARVGQGHRNRGRLASRPLDRSSRAGQRARVRAVDTATRCSTSVRRSRATPKLHELRIVPGSTGTVSDEPYVTCSAMCRRARRHTPSEHVQSATVSRTSRITSVSRVPISSASAATACWNARRRPSIRCDDLSDSGARRPWVLAPDVNSGSYFTIRTAPAGASSG